MLSRKRRNTRMPKVIDLPTATTMDDSDYLLMEESSGGTKKITRANAVSPIGTIYSAVSSVNSLPTSSATVIASLNLQKGSYVVNAQFRAAPGSGFHYYVSISTTSGFQSPGLVMFPASASTDATFTMSRPLSLSSAGTVNLVAYQGSGSAKTLNTPYCRLDAIRIA